jgi:hypothetical protein
MQYATISHLNEIYGTVKYVVLDGLGSLDYRTFTGWVYANGDRVIARKPRGRNVWHLCNMADVVTVAVAS